MLGEFFRCRYDYPDGTRGFYIAEQGTFVRFSFMFICGCSTKEPLLFDTASPVSHHPPISAFYYISPANQVAILGELRPKSKFLGNSVSTTMEGENRIRLMGRPEDGGACLFLLMLWIHLLICLLVATEYVISMPNMYARGILWGRMVLELGDSCTAKNEKNGLSAELSFKTKVRHLPSLSPLILSWIFRGISAARTTPLPGAFVSSAAT